MTQHPALGPLSSSPQTHPHDELHDHPLDGHLTDPVEHTHEAFSLLAAGVPLTLLLDLATTVDSQLVYDREPGSADWLPLGLSRPRRVA